MLGFVLGPLTDGTPTFLVTASKEKLLPRTLTRPRALERNPYTASARVPVLV